MGLPRSQNSFHKRKPSWQTSKKSSIRDFQIPRKLTKLSYSMTNTSAPAGQLYELIAGHDRLVIDIRPHAFRKLGLPLALSCHPYDLCTALVARAAGVIVRTPDSSELNIPFDTTSPVSWVAYANETLATTIHPVVETLIQKHFP